MSKRAKKKKKHPRRTKLKRKFISLAAELRGERVVLLDNAFGRLGTAIKCAADKIIPDTAEEGEYETYCAQWRRFSRRWANHPRFGAAAVMVVWEWSKARFEVKPPPPGATEYETQIARARWENMRARGFRWFAMQHRYSRMAIVKAEIKRLGEERRNRLRKRYLQAS